MHESNSNESRTKVALLEQWVGSDPERLEQVREAATDWQAQQLLQDAFGEDEYPTLFS